jgi:hypothetical protein
MRNWNKFFHLSARERWLLVLAVCVLPTTTLMLHLFGFKRTRSVLTIMLPIGKRLLHFGSPPEVEKTARAVKVAAHFGLSDPKCLARSLVLWWFLQCQELTNQIRIGVRKNADKFEAHAWVEFQGRILNDFPDIHERFSAFTGELLDIP